MCIQASMVQYTLYSWRWRVSSGALEQNNIKVQMSWMKCKKWIRWVSWSRSTNTVPEAKWATVQRRVQSRAKLCEQCCIIMIIYHGERAEPNVLLICLLDSGELCTFQPFLSPPRQDWWSRWDMCCKSIVRSVCLSRLSPVTHLSSLTIHNTTPP